MYFVLLCISVVYMYAMAYFFNCIRGDKNFDVGGGGGERKESLLCGENSKLQVTSHKVIPLLSDKLVFYPTPEEREMFLSWVSLEGFPDHSCLCQLKLNINPTYPPIYTYTPTYTHAHTGGPP